MAGVINLAHKLIFHALNWAITEAAGKLTILSPTKLDVTGQRQPSVLANSGQSFSCSWSLFYIVFYDK